MKRSNSFRPSVETLEDRRVPTATLNVVGNVLQFTGTTTGEVLDVTYDVSAQTYTFRDITNPISYNGGAPNEFAYVPLGSIKSVEIISGGGDNVFYVESANNSVHVIGGAGNDELLLGNNLNNLAPLVTFAGGGGYNVVSVNDTAGPSVGHNYHLTDQLISRDGFPVVTYDAQTNYIYLDPAGGDNTIHVYSTSATAQTQIALQPTGTDIIHVGNGTQKLDDIQGPLVIQGADGSLGRHDDLILNDTGSSLGNSYQVGTWGAGGTGTSLRRNGQLLVSASALRNCDLNTGAGNDTVAVDGTAPGTTYTINTNAGDDHVDVGSAYSFDTMLGTLVLHGGSALRGNSLHIIDTTAAAGHAYHLQANEFDRTTGNAIQPIHFTGFRTIQIDLTAFDDVLDVAGTPVNSIVTANMGAGNDTILGTMANNHFYLNAADQGFMTGPGLQLDFISAENIRGWTGMNRVHFLVGSSLSGNITGLTVGNNTLDYSAFIHDVKVNLEKHTATAVGGSVSGFENVIGGAGNDLLVGDDLPNFLEGGSGNDVLVGGGGFDWLMGGPGNDLLIGGTAFNYDQASLDAVWLEWTNPDPADDFMTKIGHLTGGGGLNGNVKLITGQTVISEGPGGNILSGGPGNNWVLQ